MEAAFETAVSKIDVSWDPIFKKHRKLLDDCLNEVIKITKYEKLSPPMELIFSAFTLPINKIKVIIIGQDPYPTKGDAHGLSFSTLGKKTPESLKNIFKCLNKNNFVTETNNLQQWTLQGVLLLNIALTTEIGEIKKHLKYWTPFTKTILKELSDQITDLHFILWGRVAEELETYINSKHNIHKWIHPSPNAQIAASNDKKFINCDHFTKINIIDWNLYKNIDIYTDGGDILHKKSSYAVYSSRFIKMYGLVKENTYIFEDNNITIKDNTNIPPTSQRGEYLAIIYALFIVYKNNLKDVRIITDSANAKGILTEWKKKNTEKYINSDLVSIMRELYSKIKVEVIHVKSHKKEESEFNEGNEIADKLAAKALKLDNYIPNIE